MNILTVSKLKPNKGTIGELGGVENRTIRGSVQMTLATNSGQINSVDTLEPLDPLDTLDTLDTGGTDSALP